MGTKKNPGLFYCYKKAEHDEPMFVLLGRDPAAPQAIRAWAGERCLRGKNYPDDEQIREAFELANWMEDWALKRAEEAEEKK